LALKVAWDSIIIIIIININIIITSAITHLDDNQLYIFCTI